MRIQVSAIGRLKPGPERELASHYVMRAGASVGPRHHLDCHCRAPRIEAATARLRREEEAGRLLSGFSGTARLVALDEAGRPLGSAEFAQMIRSEIDHGTPLLGFLIGGPDEIADSVRESAGGGILSLGRMTWPHRLARVMIAEQIYRAVTILINHPYHRG